MPSHIYYRIGRYLDALTDNKRAVQVDEAYLTNTSAPMGVYRLGYYPPNAHFVMAAAQLAGGGPPGIRGGEKGRGRFPAGAARGAPPVRPREHGPQFPRPAWSS